MCDTTTIKDKEGETMKPTVKSFLALAEEQEQPVHIARFVFDDASEYCDEELFCGEIKYMPTHFADEKVLDWTMTNDTEIVLYIK